MTELKEQKKKQKAEKQEKPLGFRILKKLLYAFYPRYTMVGEANIPDEPCVIIGNHAQIHGPIACELYMPENTYCWCAGQMMVKEEVPEYAYKDFWSYKPKWTKWFYKIAAHLGAPLSVLIFNNARTIPVWHDRRIVKTFRMSEEKLEEGCNVVIFPEYDDGKSDLVSSFNDGFAELARFYYRHYGKILNFVPMYVSPRLRRIQFGNPISYDPDSVSTEERHRISEYLRSEVRLIAKSIEKHKVVPYRNVKKREYPKNKQ